MTSNAVIDADGVGLAVTDNTFYSTWLLGLSAAAVDKTAAAISYYTNLLHELTT
ncbi:MAG: hypothetical protein NVS3B11_12620 [Collimonas sp.]